MIPKIIHYCWFGSKAKNETSLLCIASWKTHCPDYTFMEWTEANTKKYQNRFYKQAYAKKHYAFVADCVRVQALEEHGGIYLDTDMLLLKPLDTLLEYDFFTAFEVSERPAYGLFGGIPGHRFFKEMSAFYNKNYFNPYSLPVITHTFKNLIIESSLHANEHIFSPDYFYCLPYQEQDKDYKAFLTKNSVAVHLWDHSWKASPQNTARWYIKNLLKVALDYLFYSYPYSYYKRYTRGFSRQLFYKLFKKHKAL